METIVPLRQEMSAIAERMSWTDLLIHAQFEYYSRRYHYNIAAGKIRILLLMTVSFITCSLLFFILQAQMDLPVGNYQAGTSPITNLAKTIFTIQL